MSILLTSLARLEGFSLGADLVGVGNIERWENAPLLMSPAGIMPSARSVVVCAIHHTDAMIEIGGEGSPHDYGSYFYQYYMNKQLDVISYRLACFFEDRGYRAVPIVSSNIWRYRNYKDLEATFAPDMSHIYASVCAGLTEMGYSGLAMSPEYGPRNRFVSIITDAPLVADPLLAGETLCDHCGQCIEHCYAEALNKEIAGLNKLVIEGNTYTFANKNLWRCAWSEHFGLDSELEFPEKVTEDVVLQRIKEVGLRGGTMGCCLKHCLPKDKRSWDKDYSSAPIRKKNVVPAYSNPDRGVQQEMLAMAFAEGADRVVVQKFSDLEEKYGNLKLMLPDGRSVVWFQSGIPGKKSANEDAAELILAGHARPHALQHIAFTYASKLEKLGYSAAPYPAAFGRLSPLKEVGERIQQAAKDLFGEEEALHCTLLVTSADLQELDQNTSIAPLTDKMDLKETIERSAKEAGVDLFGVTSVERLTKAVNSVKADLCGQTVFDIQETGVRWLSSVVSVDERLRELQLPTEHLPNAKSVIVLGLRTPQESSERMGREPAEAIGPYTFAQFQSSYLLAAATFQVLKRMDAWGYESVALTDLENTGSTVATPRGFVPNLFSNRISAVCAGLGTLTKGGFVNTEKYGTNVRFVAIVTDAELAEDQLADLANLRSKCEDCERCINNCVSNAFKGQSTLSVENEKLDFYFTDQQRCDWALRYGLMADEGNKFTGSKTNIPVPEKITPENLAAAMAERDPILLVRPCSAEMCAMACPYTRTQE